MTKNFLTLVPKEMGFYSKFSLRLNFSSFCSSPSNTESVKSDTPLIYSTPLASSPQAIGCHSNFHFTRRQCDYNVIYRFD